VPIVANTVRYVVGVDTHAKTHTYAVVTCPGGELIDQRVFPTHAAGRQRALTWITERTEGLNHGDLDSVLVAVEGTGSYGATIATDLAVTGLRVVEAPTPTRSKGRAKTDALDAAAAARSTMTSELTGLRDRRGTPGVAGEVRDALAVLTTAREQLNTTRLAAINALTALVRTHDLGIDARRALTTTQITQITRWRARTEPLGAATARTEAIRLATHIVALDSDLRINRTRIADLVTTHAPHLTTRLGVGPVTAASVLIAWSHPGRVRSEAAFAMIAGTAPLEASSGNTTRHRLNRGGDRRLNKAVHTITLTRTGHDPATKAYIQRRRAEGKTDREIRRCLKRYITRQLYRDLNNPHRLTNPALDET
jgi:transposase